MREREGRQVRRGGEREVGKEEGGESGRERELGRQVSRQVGTEGGRHRRGRMKLVCQGLRGCRGGLDLNILPERDNNT